MRIAFYGNVCNNHYQIAKALRRYSDLDVHLYLDDSADPQQLPESDDPELRNNYPDWIHKGRFVSLLAKFLPWRALLVRECSQYDLIVVSGIGPVFAQFSGRPAAFLTAGADLTMAPFPLEFLSWYRDLEDNLKVLWLGIWQRRGIRRCREVWTQPFAPFRDAVRKLSLLPSQVAPVYFPVMIDTDRITEHPSPLTSGVGAVQEVRSRFEFSVFHPSRLMMHESPKTRATGQWKGNATLFRAFAKFLGDTGATRAGLVLIDRPASPDVDAARQLVHELGIEQSVLWLKPARGFGFSRAELMAIYSICDVVADDFGVGWFGSIVLEGLAARRPVLCYVDELAMAQLYPWHPLLSSRSVDGNTEFLLRLYRDAAFRRERGAEGRRWVEEFHAPASVGRIYRQRMREIVEPFSVREPPKAQAIAQ